MKEKFYLLSQEKVLQYLKTSAKGLSKDEVKQRLSIYGKNVISIKKKISPLELYIDQFKNTLTLILVAAAFLILFIYYFGEKDNSDLIEAGLILAIVIMITVLGFIQEYKAEKAIESLKKLLAFKAKVRRDGIEDEIDVSEIVPGDIIVLEEGLKIPADMRLLQDFNLRINEASLTGESVSVSKSLNALSEEAQLADQHNMLFSGTVITSGRGEGVVVSTGDNTEIGKIAKNVAEVEEGSTPLQKRLDGIGRIIGYVILGICAIVFVFIMFFAKEFADESLLQRTIHSFIAAVALAVAAIPEGLPAVVTISLAFGTQRLLKKNALIRKLSSVETLGSTDTICSDKTGTLTKGEMTVKKIFFNDNLYEVEGTGYSTKGNFLFDEKKVSKIPFNKLLSCGLYCNNASLHKDGKILGDPTEAALLVSAAKAGITASNNSDISDSKEERVIEIPFSSERKLMTIAIRQNNSYFIYAKGATEVILKKCSRIIKGNDEIPLSKNQIDRILRVNDDLSSQALRNLGFAYKKLTEEEFERESKNEKLLEKNLTFLGIQSMIDPPRMEVKPLVAECKKSGIRIIMITGDHVATAQAVAHEIGIEGKALTGYDLDRLNDDDFLDAVESISIYARINPSVKMRIVDALKKKGHIVAMTGDGVNDAPALKKADIGIAMGITGTDVAKEASDMVLLDDKFSTIVAAIKEGRGIFHNIRKFVTNLISTNIAEVMIVFFGVIIFQNLLLTATMLLWINVVTDGIPSIALAIDPAEKGIMRYNPRSFQTEIIHKRLWIEMVIFAILITVQIFIIYIINIDKGISVAHGTIFLAIVIFEFLYLFIIRSSYKLKFFSNKWLFISITTAIILQVAIIYIPFLRELFEISTISFSNWAYIIFAGIWMILLFKLFQISLNKLFVNNNTESNR